MAIVPTRGVLWWQTPACCQTCAFWVVHSYHRSGEGECRRNPPLSRDATHLLGYWPQSHSTSWCGEWRRK